MRQFFVLFRKLSNFSSKQNKQCKYITTTCLLQPKSIKITHTYIVKYSKMSSTSTFKGNADRYEGITVNSIDENCNDHEFPSKLAESLKEWTRTKKRGIWFKVYLKHSSWVPTLTKNGFIFHHARPDFVMLYKWLSNEPCNVPPYAHTMIGAGAVVVNSRNEVLVVREKYSNVLPFWKLPGGYVEPGENLVHAIIREVKEETNIGTEFDSLISLRHAHGGSFGCSDIYIVMSLKPLQTEIKKCDQEIAECKWMPIGQYLSHSDIHELNKLFVKKYLEYKQNNVKIECKEGIHQLLKKPYTVFSATMKKSSCSSDKPSKCK